MAQTGFTPIVTYNTATATTVPSAANLAQGELAVNVTDKKLYTKDSGGNVVLLASNGGDVTGPASSTNLAIPTFSGTGGKTLLNNSGVTITAGVITATGFNKMAITAPATSSTLAVADGKTLTANKTLTLDGTDSTTQTFPTTSATIARTDAAQTFTSDQTLSTGNIIQGTAAKGFNFTANTPAAGMTSQLLNWYEEGTFTPAYNTSDNNLTGFTAYSGTFGRYTRIGRICHIHIELATINALGIAGTGYVIVTGLPFSADKVTNTGVAFVVMDSLARWAVPPTLGLINSAYGTTATQIILFASTGVPTTVANFLAINNNDFNTLTINFTYQIA